MLGIFPGKSLFYIVWPTRHSTIAFQPAKKDMGDKMIRFQVKFIALTISLLIPFLFSANLQAQEYEAKLVADTNTPVPGGTGTFDDFVGDLDVPDIISLDEKHGIAFVAESGTQSGIYGYRNGELFVIADTNTPIPMGKGNFTSFDVEGEPVSLDGGILVFSGVGISGQFGLYKYNTASDELTVVADRNTPIPNGIGNFTFFNQYDPLGSGDLVFSAEGQEVDGTFQTGIYKYTTATGTITKIADIFTAIPGEKETFEFLFFAGIDNTGESADPGIGDVVFRGSGEFSAIAWYKYSGATNTIVEVVQLGDPVPMGTGVFNLIAGMRILDNGDVIFRQGNNDLGYYKYSSQTGTLSPAVTINTPIPGGVGNFRDFDSPVILSGGGDFIFQGFGDNNQRGLYKYAMQTGTVSLIIDRNNPLPISGNGNFAYAEAMGRFGLSGLIFTASPQQGPGNGLFVLSNNDVSKVVNSNDPAPIGTGNFDEFDTILTIFGKDIAFSAFDEGGNEGIYIASKATRTLTVEKRGSGDGNITTKPDNLVCNVGCTGAEADFDLDSMVLIKAKPASNSIFAGWGGACRRAGSKPTATVYMRRALKCIATFKSTGPVIGD